MTPAAVLATVLGYIAVLFAVAWISGRRADNAGFFTGNRRTPWYMAAFAMIGAAISGVTFISVPGSVAVDSFSYMQMVAGFTVGQFVVAFVLIPLFYRLRVVSLYEYLDDRFGVASHRTGAWFFFISKILGAALRVYVVCAVLQLLVFDRYGLPFWFNALITMAFVWLYTQQGGVKSLIWTDSLKTFCLVASLVLSIVFIMRGLDFSFSDTVREVSSSPMSRIFFFDDPASDRYFWKMFAAGIVLLVCMTGLDQDLMQRNMSCATPRDSQKNIVLTAVSQIVVIFLFLVLPTFLTGGLLHFFPDFPMWGRNLIEGVLKVAIFLLYLIFCSKQKDIYRVFQYHGAEHKTIFCYEAGLPLTVENVRIQPRHHPRCGTSFLFVVIFVSILVSSVVFGIWPITNVWLRTLAHLILLPLVVGITYEFNRWVGRHVQDSRLAKILTAPGMWMQNFTTNEPDDSMIECAIRSLELVLPSEKGKDEW